MKARYPQISQITQTVTGRGASVGLQGVSEQTHLKSVYIVCVICEIWGEPFQGEP